MSVRVCIASTVREPEGLLEPFLRYHLGIGFDHVFLFFDDPGDPSAKEAAGAGRVTVVRSTHALRREQLREAQTFRGRGFAGAPGEYPNVVDPGLIDAPGHSGLIVRQQLNLMTAMRLARAERLDWLLSIDVDELFYLGGRPAAEHFGALSDKGLRFAVYLNHEAIPEQLEIQDPFREVSLFVLNPQARRAGLDAPRFRAYRNGKAGVRLSETALPSGSHHFRPLSGSWTREERRSRSEPCILHYAECGFERFARKYATLGDFPDEYFPGVPAIRWLTKCRDLWQQGDVRRAEKFYRERVVAGEEQANRWLETGACRRFGPFETGRAPPKRATR